MSSPKKLIFDAYRKVKANRGAAGVDEQSVAEFEAGWKDNLYKLWNRMSSGAYFPPPVRAVEIPKKGNGQRVLGIPTVADRVAQTAVAMLLEPEVEPLFHNDSYGYRPGRSALDAIGVCRNRCWKSDWVVDLDIRSFFMWGCLSDGERCSVRRVSRLLHRTFYSPTSSSKWWLATPTNGG